MFSRIIVGILIGFVAGFIEARSKSWSDRSRHIGEALIFVVGIAFIGSSFMFGAVFGVMAIAEIALGFYAFAKVFKRNREGAQP